MILSATQCRFRTPVRTYALFGGSRREQEKEEMWKRQQEILAERRSGSSKSIEEAMERRKKVQQEAWAKEDKKRQDRETLARGGKLAKDNKKVYSDEDNELGIVIPLAPFGIPKYDNGERFDLKLPYVDKGWVDPEADPVNWFKKLFNKKKSEEEEEE